MRINWLQVPEHYQHLFVANHLRKHGHQCGGDGGVGGAESLNDQSAADEQLIQVSLGCFGFYADNFLFLF